MAGVNEHFSRFPTPNGAARVFFNEPQFVEKRPGKVAQHNRCSVRAGAPMGHDRPSPRGTRLRPSRRLAVARSVGEPSESAFFCGCYTAWRYTGAQVDARRRNPPGSRSGVACRGPTAAGTLFRMHHFVACRHRCAHAAGVPPVPWEVKVRGKASPWVPLATVVSAVLPRRR
jgi:hypothetical protein